MSERLRPHALPTEGTVVAVRTFRSMARITGRGEAVEIREGARLPVTDPIVVAAPAKFFRALEAGER